MSTEVIAGPLGEERTASTAGGGTALSTTAVCDRLPLGTRSVVLTPRNFSTAVVVKYHFNPWLTVLKTTDAMATAPTDYSNAAQDLGAAAAGVVLSSLDTLANGDFLLVGSHLPVRGYLVDVNATHAGDASTLAVFYWNGTAWADASATDGTAAAGKTFAQDGNVTFTVPTAWKRATLASIYTTAPNFGNRDIPMYWTRWSVSAALDASVTLDRLLALNRNSARYAEVVSGQVLEKRVLHGVPGGVGCIELLTDAGTANAVITAFAAAEQGGFAS